MFRRLWNDLRKRADALTYKSRDRFEMGSLFVNWQMAQRKLWIAQSSIMRAINILTYVISQTVSQLSRGIGHTVSVDRECLCLTHSFGVNP